ncbi:hypothetical protein Pint_14361 [Pistacia integerrima]|uniref:Uncharacterized protein n=2 Tax=Pistacia TaxID=55512 RepID=A0ACC1AWM9_9ROSI|nr:hypothetical protein Pint_14361 [Pistacia integerrima]KAJ0091100.1 hypothetical protein Patl1_14554 [Pistacia atlantica]
MKERKQELIRLREDLREAEATTVAVVVKMFANFALRLKERRRRTGDSNQRRRFTEVSYEDQVEQLKASVDFLVELCDTVSLAKEGNFANWSHQTLDFILGEVLT